MSLLKIHPSDCILNHKSTVNLTTRKDIQVTAFLAIYE